MSLADEILVVLDNPTHMWSHALKELSHESQRLFLTLSLLPQPLLIDDLQAAYSTQSFNKTEPFLDSLRVLDDSFVSISAGTDGKRWVDFRNPSLEDFSVEYLSQYSDWLDSLLSAPVYYEQIASVYELAMARRPGQRTLPPRSAGPPYTQTFHEGAVKYSGIHSWVIKRHGDLLAKAIDLALANATIPARVQYGKSDPWTVLKQIAEIMLTYNESIDRARRRSFIRLIERALEPIGAPSANAMFEMLRERKTGELIGRYSVNNAMKVLRSNILEMDTWKFILLSKIDKLLEIDPEESLMEWGNDFVSYADQTVEDLSHSNDWAKLDGAIREIDQIARFRGLDLYDSISALKNRRESLQSEKDENYEDDESHGGSAGSRGPSDSRQLDNMFASFLG